MERKSYDIQEILREMREDYWRSIEEGGSGEVAETRDYVVFRLGGESFAIPGYMAREVLRLTKVVKVPRLPAQLLGIINLRGQILAVTDLRPLLGFADRGLPEKGQLLVVEAGGLTTALLTEGVEGLRSIETAAIEPITEGLAGFPREISSGHLPTERGLLVLLDLEHILTREEFTIDQMDRGL